MLNGTAMGGFSLSGMGMGRMGLGVGIWAFALGRGTGLIGPGHRLVDRARNYGEANSFVAVGCHTLVEVMDACGLLYDTTVSEASDLPQPRTEYHTRHSGGHPAR